MTSVRDVAAQLRAATYSMPTAVVGSVDDELEAAVALLSETLTSSIRHDEVVGEVSAVRTSLVQRLNELIGVAKRAIVDKADELARWEGSEAGESAPTPQPYASKKVAQLQGQRLPKCADKAVNAAIHQTPGSGWAVEKNANSHVVFYGPRGEREVFSSTPGSGVNERKVNNLMRRIKNDKEGRKT